MRAVSVQAESCCVYIEPKIYLTHAWQNSKFVWQLGRSSCSSLLLQVLYGTAVWFDLQIDTERGFETAVFFSTNFWNICSACRSSTSSSSSTPPPSSSSSSSSSDKNKFLRRIICHLSKALRYLPTKSRFKKILLLSMKKVSQKILEPFFPSPMMKMLKGKNTVGPGLHIRQILLKNII